MSKKVTKNQTYLILMTVLLALCLIVSNVVLSTNYPAVQLRYVVNFMMILFYLSAMFSGIKIIRSTENRPQDLIRSVMMSITIKLLAYLVILGVIIYLNKDYSKEIVAFFFVFYLLFTITEKLFLIRFLQK